ncbi:DUF4331 family protein [Dyella halodurans]|uniref:DUF4331 family protein n=1 Tax=Dyella halodurans TaxID=1920171 RepID=A0ABV9C2E9_9GAMM|nr:DUF4331 family protein [Dyella halodurans]
MSHHYSGPNFGFPHSDARLDLTDIYAFPKPGDTSKSILVMNVHPSSSVVPVAPTTREPFSPVGLYELKIDTNGDAVADIAFRMRVSSTVGATQRVTLTRTAGPPAAGADDDGEVILKDAIVSMGREALVSTEGDYRFFAGWRSDPFFFDTLGALDGLRFTGHDFFHDKDVCSFVIELSNIALGAGPVRLWGRTMDGGVGRYVQVERGGRPQQAVFLPGDQQGDYMASQPADDARFVATFAHSLEHAGGYEAEEALRVAKTLLPDVLLYDPTQPASFPRNGRSLTDDAADQFIAILTNGRITSDSVGPHADLLGEFPYLGPPHGE